MIRVLVIHGPNLDLPVKREEVYFGDMILGEGDRHLGGHGQEWDLSVEPIQFNHEGGG